MKNKHYDWITEFLRRKKEVEAKIILHSDNLAVRTISGLLSQQLCKLPIDEEKFKVMTARGA